MAEEKGELPNRGERCSEPPKRDYKLLVDPQIKKGQEKLIRYDGKSYNTENHGQGLLVLRDPRPRMNRLWSRRDRVELPVPRYKVDEWYVGAVPPREVTFSRLNDNITKQFMEKMCVKFGKLERVRVYYHPKTQKHMGLSKIVFSSIKSASECVKNLHMTSIMGNVIHAQIDCKGEILNKLFQKIVKGELMAETMPDVIRHTQEGMSMSNMHKDNNRQHSKKKERRRSSQDDPRKNRRPSDSQKKGDDDTKHHPHSSEQKKKDVDMGREDREYKSGRNSAQSFEREDSREFVYSQDDPDVRKQRGISTDSLIENNDISHDSNDASDEHPVWSGDLDSRIGSLLSEQGRHRSDSSETPTNARNDSNDKEVSEITDQPYNHVSTRDATSDSPRRRENRHRSNSPRGKREYDPQHEQFLHREHGGHAEEHENLYSHLHSSNHESGRYRKSFDDMSRHERRDVRSPDRYSDRHRHPRGLPPNDRGQERPWKSFKHEQERQRRRPSLTNEEIPRPRRSRVPSSPESTEPNHDMLSRQKSSDSDTPKLSLDQRLKEMTGEAITIEDHKSEVISRKEMEVEKVSVKSNGSSVDMEISEGESEENPAKNDQKHPHFDQFPKDLRKDENMPRGWNGYPRVNGPSEIPPQPGMWENPNMVHPPHGFPRDRRFMQPMPRMHEGTRWDERFYREFHEPHPFGNNFPNVSMEQLMKNRDEELAARVLSNVIGDLKEIVSRDMNRKIIETMAFKIYEGWWDENANKQKIVAKVSNLALTEKSANVPSAEVPKAPEIKPSCDKGNKMLLNSFDPLNWAKSSFEMDGFRIGLGLRSAISKMPSFRVKKRQRTPTPPREKYRAEESGIREKKIRRKDENKETERQKSTARKKRILDSEGEEEMESEEEESHSIESDKEGGNVLDVDDIFSDSDSESDERSEESDEESEAESDVEAKSDAEEELENEEIKEKETRKRKLPEEEKVEESQMEEEKEREKGVESEGITEKSDDSQQRFDENKTSKVPLSSLLSPSALLDTVYTPEQLSHIHPKKRHRLMSSNAFEKSEDEISLMSNKEKTALEALTDMQMTPDRRLSSQSTDSVPQQSPLLSDSALTDSRTISAQNSSERNDSMSELRSPNHELEAVEALLSIKKSLPPISPPVSKPQIDMVAERKREKIARKVVPRISTEERMLTAELAEEHNYFAHSFSPKRVDNTVNPIVAQISEEHSYCQPHLEGISYQSSDNHEETAAPPQKAIFYIEDYADEILSAAELVKLRRDQKLAKKHRVQKEKENLHLHYPSRKQLEEMIILYQMWNNGVDLEDLKYLRNVYEDYLEKSNAPSWVNEAHWVPYPITNVPKRPHKSRKRHKRGKGGFNVSLEEPEPHVTGSARTEGYYPLAWKVKLKQRRLMYGQTSQESSMPRVNSGTELVSGAHTDPTKTVGSRENRHFMRRIASEVGADVGDLFKYNQLMFRKKAVKFKRSSIHGWGLFAEEDIGADEMVIEYVGQVVRTLVAERREVHYTEIGIGSSYLFRIDTEHIIDATKCGNYARFMNHSCNPSCYAKVITVDTVKKIVIYSKGPIKKGDEITYDYKFPLEDDKIMCYCGAENCRRTLN